ncbi:phage baseplate assembly protein V [Roseomonas marmotae]|uniref:Phage baseplate assembly protein V n=1 Tax=Roseomonas marmotae TaxID=2768161 RepID=A0ABS3KFF2_9PROT|nr:phage baseplate assembly protein V [Roseomonas marmotae]MBO1076178.1 phage baseplate assembly protein V [Roseomonas marmotae]QTI81786.1 phage baseplate assembly protein V [Roseomonas marmotae]
MNAFHSGTESVSRMEGLVTGTVADVDDPLGEGRIRVNIDNMPGKPLTDWAPVAAAMSGGGRGCWLMPEVGDEAVVGFLHGDPKAPLVLGFLWNGRDKPPSKSARERMIRSLNGHTIRLIDADPEAGAQGAVVIEDAHGNRITLSNGRISISAVALLALEAPIITLSGTGWSRVVSPSSNPI